MAARRSRRSSPAPRKPKKRARLVAPHPSAGRGKCSSCGRWHTKSEHWSHKANAGAKSYRKKRGVGEQFYVHYVDSKGNDRRRKATSSEAAAGRSLMKEHRASMRKIEREMRARKKAGAKSPTTDGYKKSSRSRSDAPRFSGSDAQKRAVSRQRKAAKEAFLAGVKAGKRDAARRAA